MKHKEIRRPGRPSLRELYPHLSGKELEEAEINLRAYVEVAISVYQRLQADPEAMAEFEALLDKKEKEGKFESPTG